MAKKPDISSIKLQKQKLRTRIELLKKEMQSLDELKMTTLAKNILNYRHERNLTQEDLAKLVGRNRASIAHIERRGGSTTIDNLMLLCQAFNVTPNDLLLPRDEAAKIDKTSKKVEKDPAVHSATTATAAEASVPTPAPEKVRKTRSPSKKVK